MCFEVSNTLKILQSFCLCLNEKQILLKGVEDLDRMTMNVTGLIPTAERHHLSDRKKTCLKHGWTWILCNTGIFLNLFISIFRYFSRYMFAVLQFFKSLF